jgi:hypothetical protein
MRSRNQPLRAARLRVALCSPAACAAWFAGAVAVLGCSLLPVNSSFESHGVLPRFSAEHYPYLHGDIRFSHEVHDVFGCETCHASSRSAEGIRAGDLPAMATCFDCHDGDPLTRECEACHRVNRARRKPRFHVGTWISNHKDMAYNEAYKCSLCHAESSCQQCHAVRKPQSHTVRFNRSTHGRFATHDRRSCATCHQPDFCINCHNQPPPDHTPTFMGPIGHRQVARLKLRACLTCHRFESNDCSRSGCHGV